MAVLINDRDSLSKTNLKVQDPPKSLLNSRRMYWQLLDALDGMEAEKKSSGGSTNTEELDLFVTATDMAGQIIKLQLADRTVRERRHRKVFHFVFCVGEAGTVNDFKAANNPFLAFAARATSAHPAAFEPMSLSGIDHVLRRHDKYSENSEVRAANPDWRKFYDEYLRGPDDDAQLKLDEPSLKTLSAEFANRAFNDGGVLDNQPFSHTLDTLAKHHSDFPTVRKLLYIEPAPEHPRSDPDLTTPDFVSNAWLSLSTLPRYEPIREHLQRVLERNRLIERVEHITQGMEEDIRVAKEEQLTLAPMTTEEFRTASLGKMVHQYGFGWASYQRLRVAEVTDELVRLICRTWGFDEDSEKFITVRQVVRGWRDLHYAANPDTDKRMSAKSEPKRTQTWFLMYFDVLWRLRRLRFVMSKIDDLACFDKRGETTFKAAVDPEKTGFDYRNSENLRDTLLSIRAAVGQEYRTLRQKRQTLWNSPIGAPPVQEKKLEEQVAAVRKTLGEISLGKFLSSDSEITETARRDRVRKKIEISPEDAGFVLCLGKLEEVLNDWFSNSRRGIEEALATTEQTSPGEKLLKDAVRFYFDNFDRYDMVAHPILFATDAGDELSRVEVFRISPEDATNIIDEAETGKKKLFGTKLSNFGAFFKRDFRTNDILWGRLDGAERIITSLLPDSKYVKSGKPSDQYDPTRDQLITEAQNAILKEVLGVEDESQLRLILADFASRALEVNPDVQLGAEAAQNLTQLLPEPRVKFALTSFLKNQTPKELFRESFVENYETLRQFNNQEIVTDAARASKVFGRMLEGYADDHKLNKKRVTWVTRMAQLFWGLVEVAIPGSIANLVFQHWLKLVYLFEFLLILLGTLLTNRAAQQFGWLTFGITVTIHAAQLVLSDTLTGRHWLRRFLVALSILAVLFLTVMGGFTVLALFYAQSLWDVLSKIHAWQANPDAPGRTPLKAFLITVVAAFLLRSLWKGLSERVGTRWLALLPLLLGVGITGGLIYSFYISASRHQTLPHGLHMPGLAIEMATTPAEVVEIEKFASRSGQDAAAGVQKLRSAVDFDFGFIAWYTAVFLLFSYWLKRRRLNLTPGLAWVAVGFALATALFDVAENFQLYSVLRAALPDAAMLQRLHVLSLLKWIFCFNTLILLALLFLSRKDLGYLFGLGLMLIAILGFVGVYYYRLIEFAFLGLGLLLILIGFFALIAPGRFLSREQVRT